MSMTFGNSVVLMCAPRAYNGEKAPEKKACPGATQGSQAGDVGPLRGGAFIDC